MAEVDFVLEQLRTIHNLCEVCIHYKELGYKVDKGSILATLIEEMYQECQQLTDDNCVVRDS